METLEDGTTVEYWEEYDPENSSCQDVYSLSWIQIESYGESMFIVIILADGESCLLDKPQTDSRSAFGSCLLIDASIYIIGERTRYRPWPRRGIGCKYACEILPRQLAEFFPGESALGYAVFIVLLLMLQLDGLIDGRVVSIKQGRYASSILNLTTNHPIINQSS